MPFTVETLIENKVILTTAFGVFNLDEIQTASDQIYRLMDACDGPVHVIADATAMTEYPLNFTVVYESSKFLRHPKLGYVVLVGVHTLLLNMMIRGIIQLSGVKAMMASSVDKALAKLRERDSSIGPHSSVDSHSANSSSNT